MINCLLLLIVTVVSLITSASNRASCESKFYAITLREHPPHFWKFSPTPFEHESSVMLLHQIPSRKLGFYPYQFQQYPIGYESFQGRVGGERNKKTCKNMTEANSCHLRDN